MSLASDTRLGQFEIAQPLGSGGKGGVYKRRDARLDGTGAIKSLPAHTIDLFICPKELRRTTAPLTGACL
jgi:hypothetical protein